MILILDVTTHLTRVNYVFCGKRYLCYYLFYLSAHDMQVMQAFCGFSNLIFSREVKLTDGNLIMRIIHVEFSFSIATVSSDRGYF